jgi:hypothetical protein
MRPCFKKWNCCRLRQVIAACSRRLLRIKPSGNTALYDAVAVAAHELSKTHETAQCAGWWSCLAMDRRTTATGFLCSGVLSISGQPSITKATENNQSLALIKLPDSVSLISKKF